MRYEISIAEAIRNFKAGRILYAGAMGLAVTAGAPPASAQQRYATGAGCDNCCPSPDGNAENLVAMMGRRVPGFAGPGSKCADSMISMNNTAVVANGAVTLTVSPQITMCVTHIEVVTTGAAGFSLQNFMINNEPQWQIGNVFHSDMFAPGADTNTRFKGDCVQPGSVVTMLATNLDALTTRGIFVALKGPSAR